MKKFSTVNGKATKLSKPLTAGSYAFIVRKAGKMSAKSIAAILHRPVQTVHAAARRLGITL
jgi:hypothetical protein